MDPLPPVSLMHHTPKQLGYRFPAEWEPHEATWLSWPHRESSWPKKLGKMLPIYAQFVAAIAQGEKVCINVNNAEMRHRAEDLLCNAGADLQQIHFFDHPTNDAWCRDHGPAFLIREVSPEFPIPSKALVGWKFNSWGEKYPHNLDEQIPTRIALQLNLPCFTPSLVMEGGSVEFNGAGTLLTTKCCLLNPNRNPHLTPSQIEEALKNYYCIDQVLWLEHGITGDDTDGHIDDLTRFVNRDTVITMIARDASHPDYQALKENLQTLSKMRLLDGKSLNIVEIPLPTPYEEEGIFFPCSYANFYICNAAVIVPTFQVPEDDIALEILSRYFPDRKIIGLYSKDLIWGFGSFHCLSQQEPLIV